MIGRAYGFLQILSIDIVIGALTLLHFFCSYFSVSATFGTYLILGCTTWLIYTTDHLRDAKKAPNSKRIRYQFHLKHAKKLKAVVVIAIVAISVMVFQLHFEIIKGGIVLALLSAVYLIIQKRLASLGLKELYVALVYTSGILLVPFILLGSFEPAAFLLLLLLTYSNLLLFSWFEKEEDKVDLFVSIGTVLDGKKLELLILFCLALGIAISILQDYDFLSCYFFLAFIIYAYLLIKADTVKKNQLYRLVGDGVFIIPLIFALLERY